jgi:protein-L-isoaspartate(D-aspartate) O-methyltransferase
MHARDLLQMLGFRTVQCFFRDGGLGLPAYAPFDKIVVTAGAVVVPEPLKEQLMIGGILVIPVGSQVQKMTRITRVSAKEFAEETLDDFKFVPFLKGTAKI